jgi:hypothetical protein
MTHSRRLALYGIEPVQRWGREFDRIEEKLRMGERVSETIDAIRTASNCNTATGTMNNHTLANTFAKNYYHPLKQVFTKPANSTNGWRQISVKKIIARQNFYTITHSDGTDNTSLEALFCRIETHVPSWLTDGGVNPHNRGEKEYWLAWFLATQGQRTPFAAKIRLNHNPATPRNMPTGALVAANLAEAKRMARLIFSWHWAIYKLDVYQTREEVLLGEDCVFSHGLGIICNIRRQTALVCSPEIATQCETLEHLSKEDELKMIGGLNAATVAAGAPYGGYIYRSTLPIE